MGRLAGLLASALASPGLAQEAPPPNARDETIADVVVTARPGRPAPLLDAVGYYRRHCFEANRLTGRSAMPENDPDWRPLDAENRRKFGVTYARVPAYGLVDPARGHTLLLKTERRALPRAWHAIEERCTLVVIGDRDHSKPLGGIAALFGAAGTQRHIGDPDGVKTIPGWRQWLWSGMPARGAKRWRALKANGGRGPESAWLKVVDPSFYGEYDYILGDMKSKQGVEAPITILTFTRTYRPATSAVTVRK